MPQRLAFRPPRSAILVPVRRLERQTAPVRWLTPAFSFNSSTPYSVPPLCRAAAPNKVQFKAVRGRQRAGSGRPSVRRHSLLMPDGTKMPRFDGELVLCCSYWWLVYDWQP